MLNDVFKRTNLVIFTQNFILLNQVVCKFTFNNFQTILMLTILGVLVDFGSSAQFFYFSF